MVRKRKFDNSTCLYRNCKEEPLENETYCNKHKPENRIPERENSHTCIHEGCRCKAIYAIRSSNIPLYCSKHKIEDMVMISSKRCFHENCTLQPSYNFNKNLAPIYCYLHKQEGMIDVKGKKCIHPGCNKYPSFNYITSKKRIYCGEHKKDGMVDIKRVKPT